MKTKVALFYIGLVRFEKLGKENHKKLIDILTEAYDLKIYDFTLPNIDRTDCTFEDSGRIQVYDFYTALDQIEEDIVIKFRTDIWLTDSVIDPILTELNLIVNGTQDLSYMGMAIISANSEFDNAEYYSYGYRKTGKILDWVIIADRRTLVKKEDAFTYLKEGKYVRTAGGGNHSYRVLRTSQTNTVVVCCQLYLIRKEYDTYPTDVQVGIDMIELTLPNPKTLEWLYLVKKSGGLTAYYEKLKFERQRAEQMALENSQQKVRRKLAPPPSRTNNQSITQVWKGIR
jgi:hypothetical protein